MGFVCLHQQGIYTDLSYSLEGLFIGEYRAQAYTTNHANLGANYDIRIVSLVVTITSVIVFFELIPERSVWSIPVKLEQEHMLAVPGSGGFSILLKQKQGREYSHETKEDEYEKQYYRRRRILIVDDEPDITSSFKEALRDHGFEQVDIANDPLLALKNFKEGSYDLLIIDIVMPEMDGFSLYEEIRKIDTKVKVCFITAFEINYQALRAVFPAASTTDDIWCFIRKPVDVDDLVKRINAEIQ
jgi:two-component system, OmpR family, response regulator ChvI